MQPLQLSFDFGRKTTGLALCRIEDAVDASGVAECISCSSCYSSVTAIRDALLGPCSRAALAPGQSSLSLTAVQQPQQTDGLAAAIHRYDHGMRCPATPPGNGRAPGSGIGVLRHATAAEFGHQRRRLSAGYACRLRSARVPGWKIWAHLCLL